MPQNLVRRSMASAARCCSTCSGRYRRPSQVPLAATRKVFSLGVTRYRRLLSISAVELVQIAGNFSIWIRRRARSYKNGFLDCVIIESCTIQLLTRRRSLELDSKSLSKGGWLVISAAFLKDPTDPQWQNSSSRTPTGRRPGSL